jgi:hypothetical protein
MIIGTEKIPYSDDEVVENCFNELKERIKT